MKTKSILFALLVSVFLGWAAAGSVAAETILRIGTLSNDANQLDPHISTKSQDKILFPMLFNGLVRFKPGSSSLDDMEPDLAEKWTASADGLVWTFYLRKGVQFHGGYGEFTAADVVYSLNRAADKQYSSAYQGYQDFESVTALPKSHWTTSGFVKPSHMR
jgi:peptide/nickel transport system substrate-binding protein